VARPVGAGPLARKVTIVLTSRFIRDIHEQQVRDLARDAAAGGANLRAAGERATSGRRVIRVVLRRSAKNPCQYAGCD
jgi:translation initiation factor 2B subunit (eIF-2B alpha/beta/delta family)